MVMADRRKKNGGFLFIDVLVALLIIQICLAAAIAAMVSHSKYLLKLVETNREVITTQNKLAQEFSFVVDEEE